MRDTVSDAGAMVFWDFEKNLRNSKNASKEGGKRHEDLYRTFFGSRSGHRAVF